MEISSKYIWLFILVCSASLGKAYGQLGPGISVFTQNRVYLNPAYSGVGDRAYVQLHIRNQWTGYQTTQDGAGSLGTRILSASVPLGSTGFGLGINYLSDLTPSGVGMQGANLQVAYQLAVGESHFSIGGGFGLQTKSFDGDAFRVRDSGDPLVDEISTKQVSEAKLANNLGLLFVRKKLQVGATYHPGQQFALHAEHTLPLFAGIDLNPFFRIRSIPDAVIVEPGARILYQNAVWIGGSFRSNDALIGMVGVSFWKNRIEAGYSIDYTTKNLPVKSLLTHELFCRFNLPNFNFKTVQSQIKTPRFRLN